ncbi:response regulator [Anabaena sp. UHCC 0399]|uniref:response regulator n=1 Tax=Anabaena sp. UHCC 0399 TaxID=3110238 RepID=UPI002B1F2471|nr:response regulator [Anabaena sp. UHCC 0399]MEA5567156.1 response regulator [Anabaena sp. UHCC 0399]
MQGNLQEIDIRSILQLIELGQRTGQLLIESYSFHYQGKVSKECEHKAWYIFFHNGQIIYCQEGNNNLSRINDYLRHHRGELSLDEQQIDLLSVENASEYGYLWMLLEKNIVNPEKARVLIYRLVCETLFDLLSLQRGRFIFYQDTALAPRLTSWEIAPLMAKITQQLQEWKQLYPYIQSPEQLPILAQTVHLHSSLPTTTVNKLKQWADGQTSLRQLSRYLDRDILTLAKTIYPYIQQGWLKLTYPKTTNSQAQVSHKQKMKILCIDQSKTTGEIVESILQPQGYAAIPEVITLTSSLEAISLIFQLQPNLVLCEMAMPELNGYEMCAMLRQSQAFRYIPMIMMTSKDKFIDQVKVKMIGATDLLRKPFNDAELLMLIQKYINI